MIRKQSWTPSKERGFEAATTDVKVVPDSPDKARRAAVCLLASRQAMDEFSQGLIREFGANQGKGGGPMLGMQVLLLTTTGAEGGRTLTRPLVYTRDGDRIVIVAAYGGSDQDPPWYQDIVANPMATVEVGAEKFEVRATVTSGEERRLLFERHGELMPIVFDYQRKTTRQIPVVVLTRAD